MEKIKLFWCNNMISIFTAFITIITFMIARNLIKDRRIKQHQRDIKTAHRNRQTWRN